MDTGLLNFGEEHFSFNAFDEYECPDDSTSDTNRPYFSEWDDVYERELNGDIALIPVTSDFTAPIEDIASFTEAPPEIFERFSDWNQTYINIDVAGVDTPAPTAEKTPQRDQEDFLADVDVDHLQLNVSDLENFDLATYALCDSPEKKVRPAPVKKIDVEAQKYIVEEKKEEEKPDLISSIDPCDDLIDVETVLDVNLPVLEANDALGLLEQFEATETPILSIKDKKNQDDKKHEFSASFGFDNALLGAMSTSTPLDIFEKIPKAPIDIFEEDEEVKPQAKKIKEVKPQAKKIEIVKPKPAPIKSVKAKTHASKTKSEKKTEKSSLNNKQILKALPQELIARINESGKRKTITVIPPIPNKKRPSSRSVEVLVQPPCKIPKLANKAPLPITTTATVKKEIPVAAPLKKPFVVKPNAPNRSPVVQNDHDYCSALTPYPKEPLKDSGFQSSEDDDRSLIGNQPMVKNADGKLMVSLLKVNTIKNTNTLQKKKLNLEEYKKKRLFKLTTTSQSTSSSSSACSSPLPEDENVKRIKHQEKLQKMALELLKTAPKSVITLKKEENSPPQVYPRIPESYIDFPYVIMAPPGLEVREVVNCGVNTDVSNVNNVELIESLKQLEEIEPLLKKASNKLNSNSFINAMIENIPKTRKKKVTNDVVKTESLEVERKVHYLPVHTQTVLTKSIEIQTDFDELIEDIQERYRRRLEEGSSSTCSSSIRSKSPVSVKSGSSRRRVSSPSEKSHRSRTYSSESSSSSTYSRGRRSSRHRSSCSYSQSSSSSGRSRSRTHSRTRSRSRSRSLTPRRYKNDAERLREVEERRVIYVGGILPGTKKDDLRRRFNRFGPITNVNLHFRDFGDNYGFVTFVKRVDAFKAIENGNSGGLLPRYDLSFGGRRIFCKTTYSDLDNVRDEDVANYYAGSGRTRVETDSFDDLLRVFQARLKRKP